MRIKGRIAAVAFPGLVALLLAGCATTGPKKPTTPTPANMTMEEIKVVARPEGDGFKLDSYDAQDLFDKGNELLDQNVCDQALLHYDRLLKEFSSSRLVVPTLYNSALCLERLGKLDEAVTRYRSIYVDHPDSTDVKDALFRAAGCEEQEKRWTEVSTLFATLLDRKDLDATEKLEAMVRLGAAEVETGRFEDAEPMLRQGIAFFHVGSERIENDYHMAMAQFYLGEIARRQMEAVRLPEDEAGFQRELEAKCRLLLKAQTQYVLAIRTLNPYWASAAGLRIGGLFSTLYEDIMSVPVPAWIAADEELLSIHMKARHELIRNLVVKAVHVWEETVLMAERVGIDNTWVQEVNQKLDRVKKSLEKADGRPQTPPVPDKIEHEKPKDGPPASDVPPVG